jgi:Ca2+-binding RTX toxin-like protein
MFHAAGDGTGSYDGGSGVDMVSYSQSTAGVSASLFRGIGWTGDAEGDSYTGIESLTGSGYADTLWGDNADNELHGGHGDDTIIGNGGNDYILAGFGVDVIVFSSSRAEYQIVQSGFRAEVTHLNDGVDGHDIIAHAEVLRFADGDLQLGITGTSADDTIEGHDGWFRGFGGDDLFDASGPGTGRYYGGAGRDTLDYSRSDAGVEASLFRDRGWSGDAAGDRYSGIEDLIGTNHADHLWGDNANNRIEGRHGDDTIIGNGGNDYILAGFGTDVILYSGNRADYRIEHSGIRTEVEHLNDGVDGFDVLGHAEILRFADGDFIL